jgi:hypothetical protein
LTPDCLTLGSHEKHLQLSQVSDSLVHPPWYELNGAGIRNSIGECHTE